MSTNESYEEGNDHADGNNIQKGAFVALIAVGTVIQNDI